MGWRRWLISTIAVVGAAHATASLAQSSIGSANSVQNTVEGIRGTKTSLIMDQSPLFEGERVRAGDSSRAQLVLLDNCKVDVGPNSQVALDRFRYNPDRAAGSAAVTASPGVYRFENGQRCKPFEVKTPHATVSANSEFHLLVERNSTVVSLVHGTVRIVTVRGAHVIVLDQPGATVTVYADGRVDGPAPWTGRFIASAGGVPFPYFTAAGYNWTGFYAGGNLGYGWGQSGTTSTLSAPAFTLTSGTSFPMDGVVGGVQFGYNRQVNDWVLGVEADIQATGQSGSGSLLCPVGICTTNDNITAGPAPDSSVLENFSEKLDWFGTVRARLGVTLTPTALLYATGGLAYGGIRSAITISGAGLSATLATSHTNVGWTAGAGIETQLIGNWTGKIEYLYLDLGSVSSNLPTAIPGLFGGTLTGATSSRITDNIVRVGINYKFNSQ